MNPHAAVGPPMGFVRFAAKPTEPVVLQFVDATLEVLVTRTALVGRDGPITPETWAVPGVYLLVGLPSSADAGSVPSAVRAEPTEGLPSSLPSKELSP